MPDATWVEKSLRDLEPFNSKVIVISVGEFVFDLRKGKSMHHQPIRSHGLTCGIEAQVSSL